MKFKNLFFALAAGVAMTACSSDEPAAPEGGNNGDSRFVKVSILAGNDGSRGQQYEDGKFEDGDGAESAVTGKALFVFVKDDGVVDKVEAYVPGWSSVGAGTPNIESKAEVQLQVASKDINGLIVILNPADHMADLKSVTTVTGLKTKLADFAKDAANDKFVMSNSVWETNFAAPIAEANIFATPEAGKDAEPVEVYVERIVAKARVNMAELKINQTEVDALDEYGVSIEADYSVKPVVLGAVISNTTANAYIIKSIDNLSSSSLLNSWTWIDADNKRSYWEYTSPSAITMNAGKTFNDIINDENVETKAFTEYLNPNTKTGDWKTALTAPSSCAKLLVVAQLQKDGEPVSLVQFGANYYTEESFLKYVQAYLETAGVMAVDQEKVEPSEGAEGSDGEYSTFRADEFELVVSTDGKSYEAKVVAKEGARPVREEDAATYAECLAKFAAVKFWNNGYTYYFTPIEQRGFEGMSTEEGKVPYLYGVVRNHIYNIDVESISGLGTPVPDPDQIIDPIKPKDEDKIMLKARINVLKWRVVNQTVNLD